MWDPYAKFESATLPNGLNVYACHWPERECEDIRFLIHSGADQDPVGLEGTAHFVEHVVSENAGVSMQEMRAFFAHHGASFNLGSTGYNDTRYGCFLPADYNVCQQAIEIFGGMLLSAKLERKIKQERMIILQEFNRRYPIMLQFEMVAEGYRILYGNQRLGRFVNTLGQPSTIQRIMQSDLQFYYDRCYVPANMSVVGVGGLPLDTLVRLLADSPFALPKVGARPL